MSQPPKSTIFAPEATCVSYREFACPWDSVKRKGRDPTLVVPHPSVLLPESSQAAASNAPLPFGAARRWRAVSPESPVRSGS